MTENPVHAETISADDYQPPWKDRAAEDRWAIDEGAQPAYSVPAPVPSTAPGEGNLDPDADLAEKDEWPDGEAPANAERPTRYTEDE